MRKLLLGTFLVAIFSSPINLRGKQIGNGQRKAYINALRREAEEWEMGRRVLLIKAIMTIESDSNPLALNASENAVGVLQVRPIMLREINRVVGYEKYKLEDRWGRSKSIEMFIDYQNYRNPKWDYELAARTWNGGHTGDRKYTTLSYWNRVKQEIKKLQNGRTIQHVNFSTDVPIFKVGRKG